MAEKGPSAEQQLLGLIEGQDSKKGGAKRKPPLFSGGMLKGRLAFLEKKLKEAFNLSDTDAIINIANTGLIAAICIIFVFLGLQIIRQPKKAEDLPGLTPKERKVDTAAEGEGLKDIAFYTGKIEMRNVFMQKEEEVVEEVVEQAPVQSSPLDGVDMRLKLVGLSPEKDGEESYAMIEDLQKETTFFLREGDSIIGLKVERITAGKVILTDGTRKAELR